MLERQLAKDFNETFKEFPIFTPANRQAGWPDKGIQIHNSRLVWFELKIIPIQTGSKIIRIGGLTSTQAAWLAKWQKNGGYCYLFLGFSNYDETLSQYGILRCSRWDIWLQVPKQPIAMSQLSLLTSEKRELLKWFKDLFVPQAKIGV